MSERIDVGRSSAAPGTEQSLGSLVAGASKELSNLVRSEIELAKLELTASAKRAGIGAGLLGGAGFLALLGLIFVSFALVYGLHGLGLPLGWAFLIVGVLYLFSAGLFALVARSQLKRLRPPERTIRTVRDDVEWAKHPTVAPPSRLGTGD
jgi:hypothetical protein